MATTVIPTPATQSQPYDPMRVGYGGRPALASTVGPAPGYQQQQTLATNAGYTWDPVENQYVKTGASKGKNAGEALKALQDASGLNLLGSYNTSGSGGGLGGPLPPTVNYPDNSAARNAAFARAKDQAGQTSRAAIEALRGQLAGRGLLGSGIEGGQTAEIIAQAAQGPNEVTREQAIQDALNAAHVADISYQGGITQRGQDISALEAERARQAQQLQGLLSVFQNAGALY